MNMENRPYDRDRSGRGSYDWDDRRHGGTERDRWNENYGSPYGGFDDRRSEQRESSRGYWEGAQRERYDRRDDDLRQGRYGGGNPNHWENTEYDRGGNFGRQEYDRSGYEPREGHWGLHSRGGEADYGSRDTYGAYGSGHRSGQGSFGAGYGEPIGASGEYRRGGYDRGWPDQGSNRGDRGGFYGESGRGRNEPQYGTDRYGQDDYRRGGERLGSYDNRAGREPEYRRESFEPNRSYDRPYGRSEHDREGSYRGEHRQPEHRSSGPTWRTFEEWDNSYNQAPSHGYGWGQRGSDHFWSSTDRETGR